MRTQAVAPPRVRSGWWESDRCPACRARLGRQPDEHLLGVLFCDECMDRSGGHGLTEWDDIGVGD